jgi:hypothetical protein
MLRPILIIVLGLFLFQNVFGQNLVAPQMTVSKKKPVYLTLKDGEELKVMAKKIKVKKGLILSLKVEKDNGEVAIITSEEIKCMYAAPKGIESFANKVDFISDASKWGDDKLVGEYLNQGYGYFEQSEVKIKKKTKTLLLHLLNPQFSNKVKVYNDPYAKESASIGVGPVKAGGYEKSYYMKKSDEQVAYMIKKKDYKKEFAPLWSNCSDMTKYEKVSWKQLVEHILTYSECK